MDIQVQGRNKKGKNLLKKSGTYNKTLNVLSLFSGCGGMDLGFEGDFKIHKSCLNTKLNPDWFLREGSNTTWKRLAPTKFKTVFANDIRPGARKAWTLFFKKLGLEEDLFHLNSIVDMVKRHWDGESNLFPSNIDVVTGGFPCQDFSVAGKRKGLNSHKGHTGDILLSPTEENRGKLYIWMREVIDIVRPKVFIAENVKGLISLGDVKEIIQNDFANIGESGYIVTKGQVLHSAEYGVPQSRERVFFVGLKKSALKKNILKFMEQEEMPKELGPFPVKTHSLHKDKQLLNLMPFVSLNEVLNDLKEPDQTKDPDQKAYSKARWYGNHCQGNREINLDKIGPTIRSEHHGNIEFRRLSRKHGGKYYKELDKGLIERRLTIRECCRIQTFPDSYTFVGNKRGEGVSASEAYKLIGNAVPPLLAYHFAKRLESIWPKLFKK